MARTASNSVRHRFLLPSLLLEALQDRCAEDEIPVAEMIRRMVDLAVTMKVPPAHIRVDAPAVQDVPITFTVIIPQRLLDQLNYEAKDRGLDPNELIRQTTVVYLRQRKKALARWYVDAAT